MPALLAALVLSAAIAAPAAASLLDQRSAATLVRDSGETITALSSHEHAAQSAADRFLAGLKQSCKPAPGSPSHPSLNSAPAMSSLVLEGTFELLLAEQQPFTRIIAGYQRELAQLRWSDPKIRQAIADSIRANDAELSLRPPALCGQIRAAALHKFASIPPATIAFLKAATKLPKSKGGFALPDAAKLLAPYLTSAQLAKLRQQERVALQLNGYLSRVGQRAGKQLVTILGTALGL